MHEERVSFTNSRGEILIGILHQPLNGMTHGGVILCHGMESNKESQKLVSLSRALAQRGILTLRFDFSYVGESSGKFEDITYSGEIEDLAAAFSLIMNRSPGRIGILGSSMGGTVALLFAAEKPTVAALVTIAAPIHPEQFPQRVLTPNQFQQWRDQGFTMYNAQRLSCRCCMPWRINTGQAIFFAASGTLIFSRSCNSDRLRRWALYMVNP